MTVDENAAVAIASEQMKADGRNPDSYDVSVKEHDDRWEVAFVGKHPRPPGDEFYVFVDKAEGTTETMQGE